MFEEKYGTLITIDMEDKQAKIHLEILHGQVSGISVQPKTEPTIELLNYLGRHREEANKVLDLLYVCP